MNNKTRIHLKLCLLIILFFANFFIFPSARTTVVANDKWNEETDSGYQPSLPDLTHELLALHAAQSHGNSPEQIEWIAQGAYNEDHQLIPAQGWHGWDPDTGDFWWSPTGCGPAPKRANLLFWKAVDLWGRNPESAWKEFGQSLHLLQDLSTPAHAHADPHICLLGDCDSYETWLGADDLTNTLFWINLNPPGPSWDKRFTDIPAWNNLTEDLKEQLEIANQAYGGYASGQELWELGFDGIDPILFQLSYLMAETADSFNSGGKQEYPGEVYNGDLEDPTYLSMMRDTLFPPAIEYSTMWIDYFESQINIRYGLVFLPLIQK